MATTTPRARRTAEEWEELAREKLPELQAGRRVSHMKDEIGTNDEAFRVALARIGYDSRGEPLQLKKITASRRSTLAKRVAARRAEKAPWWLIMAETDKSYAELNQLLREATNGGSAEE